MWILPPEREAGVGAHPIPAWHQHPPHAAHVSLEAEQVSGLTALLTCVPAEKLGHTATPESGPLYHQGDVTAQRMGDTAVLVCWVCCGKYHRLGAQTKTLISSHCRRLEVQDQGVSRVRFFRSLSPWHTDSHLHVIFHVRVYMCVCVSES